MRRRRLQRRPVPDDSLDLEIAITKDETPPLPARAADRDALTEEWGFRVVWHEQSYTIIARAGGAVVGTLHLRIAASLAHIESIIVQPQMRRRGAGRQLLQKAEDTAIYYNCHKVTLLTRAGGDAQRFFEVCGYKPEATLPQHTFKLDAVMMRKFVMG